MTFEMKCLNACIRNKFKTVDHISIRYLDMYVKLARMLGEEEFNDFQRILKVFS